MIVAIKNQLIAWHDALMAKIAQLGHPIDYIVLVGVYMLAGFLVGLALKHFGKFIFFTLLISGLLVFSLDYLHLISINHQAVAEFFGFVGPLTISEIGSTILNWVKSHMLQTVASVGGLLLAWLAA